MLLGPQNKHLLLVGRVLKRRLFVRRSGIGCKLQRTYSLERDSTGRMTCPRYTQRSSTRRLHTQLELWQSHYLNDGRGAWQAPTSHVGEHRAIQHGGIYQAEAHRQDHDGPYANLNMMRTHSPSPIGSQANSYHPHPEEVATRPAYSYRSPPEVLGLSGSYEDGKAMGVPEARQEPNGFPADVVAPQIALHGRTGQPTGYPSAFEQDENMEAERTLTQRPPLPASAASHAAGRAVPPAPALAPGAEPAPPSLSSAGPVVAESPGATSISRPAAQGLNADPTANAPAETKKRKKRFLPRIEFKLRLVRD
ncbi:hypothetical protein BD310DRAFT_79717 [Dichomitus squalens]|uniref:Uncharacterized protein n=1 Tax=Dichomitus squalens TaxID=114155 RepID=A0A4Q9PJN5_9APHY|nr:hypothetical protein BD310DRAFT_79717 [Dichomitus squalens]